MFVSVLLHMAFIPLGPMGSCKGQIPCHKHITFQASASVTSDKILLAEASHVMKPIIIGRRLNSSDEGRGSSME